jgi:hypothetical protein
MLKYDSSFTSFNNLKGESYAEDQMVITHSISNVIINTKAACLFVIK